MANEVFTIQQRALQGDQLLEQTEFQYNPQSAGDCRWFLSHGSEKPAQTPTCTQLNRKRLKRIHHLRTNPHNAFPYIQLLIQKGGDGGIPQKYKEM